MTTLTRWQNLLLILPLWLMWSLLFGQSANYKQPMTINAAGQVKNDNGTVVGMVTKDRVITDAKGKKIAFVDGQGNLLDAKTGKKMGRMGKTGNTYMDANGGLMFTLKDKTDSTCDIIDARGKKIGNIHDSVKATACALHCFQAGYTPRK